MMAAQFPIDSVRPDYRRFSDSSMEYVRTEFGESNPTWLIIEAEKAADGSKRRWGLTFRSIVSRVASILL